MKRRVNILTYKFYYRFSALPGVQIEIIIKHRLEKALTKSFFLFTNKGIVFLFINEASIVRIIFYRTLIAVRCFITDRAFPTFSTTVVFPGDMSKDILVKSVRFRAKPVPLMISFPIDSFWVL